MTYNKKTTSYLVALASLIYLLTGCGVTDGKTEEVSVSFTADCELLVCNIDASETLSGSDTLSSVLCDMGDDNTIDILQLGAVFNHAYIAPSSYTITCSAENSNGNNQSNSIIVSVDGLLADAGPDQTVSASSSVTLDGSLSEDTTVNTTGNVINRYQWINFNSVPARQQLSITNPELVNPTFVAPDDSVTVVYSFSLHVSVDDGVSFSKNQDVVEITVIPAGASDLLQ